MQKYSVLLSKTREIFTIDGQGERQYSTSPLFITSAFLESFFPILKGTEESTAENFIAALVKAGNIIDDDISRSNLLTDKKEVIDEISCLFHAVNEWIPAQKFPVYNLESPINSPNGKAIFYFSYRNIEAPLMPCFFEADVDRAHFTDSLLALAWAEIWHAVDYGIKARSCPYCGVVFILPPNNLQKKTCLRPACKQAYEVDRHGGIEEYREWERDRKKRPSLQKPGRPKKVKGDIEK